MPMPESIKKPTPLRTNNHTIVPKNPLILLATLCLTLQGCQSFIGMLVGYKVLTLLNKKGYFSFLNENW